jgi:predicted lipoprotein with Yx(FWY)xxD motif
VNDRAPRLKTTKRGGARRAGGAVALAVAVAAAGFLAAGAFAKASSATVSLKTTSLGAVLVNSSGRTLYVFAADRNGKSACSGVCTTYWPPVIAKGKPNAGAGIRSSLLGTTKRADGKLQVTYNRHALYTFALDRKAGDTKGQGLNDFGGNWWVVSAKGSAVKGAAPASPSPTTTTSGGYTSPYPYP